jgi:hypothetical protein
MPFTPGPLMQALSKLATAGNNFYEGGWGNGQAMPMPLFGQPQQAASSNDPFRSDASGHGNARPNTADHWNSRSGKYDTSRKSISSVECFETNTSSSFTTFAADNVPVLKPRSSPMGNFNLTALKNALVQFGQGAMRPQMDYRPGVDDHNIPTGMLGGYGEPMIGTNENWDGQADQRAAFYRQHGYMPQDDASTPTDAPAQTPQDWWRSSGDTPQSNPEMIAKSGQVQFPTSPTAPVSQPGIPAAPNVPQDNNPDPYAAVLGSRTPGYNDAQAKLIGAINAPVQKQKWWKDALVKAAEIGSNVYQGGWGDPRNQIPVEGYGHLKHDQEVSKAYQQYAPLRQMEDQRIGDVAKATGIGNTIEDNRRADQQAKDLAQFRQDTIKERDENRKSRDTNVKMRTVASMLSKIPNYDPNDPRFAEISKALGDVGLPLAPKDAKKKVQLVQDADSGAWTMTLTDPFSGQQEVRPVVGKDGKQLVTTSTARVSADAAAGRQENQFKHDDQKQQIAAQLSKEIDDHKAANAEILAEKNQDRKLQLQQAQEERQKRILQLRNQLSGLVDGQ